MVPGGRPKNLKFWYWFGHVFGFEHSAELLGNGSGELVIHGITVKLLPVVHSDLLSTDVHSSEPKWLLLLNFMSIISKRTIAWDGCFECFTERK